MTSTCRGWTLGLALLCVTVMPGMIFAQDDPPPASQQASLEDASRLTWRVETRADGIAALRRLVSDEPSDLGARFELGRVLTWDATTRHEGIALLRGVVEQAPERDDAVEALGEVLSWDVATRPEAVDLLRGLVEQAPARTSARLDLADVLSWEPATRAESLQLYRTVLDVDARSVRAAVGLGRLLAWGGEFGAARLWYEAALTWDPHDQSAQLGLAEIDGWRGRGHASLGTLAALPEESRDTLQAIQIRAQAYSQIGRPARALEQYNSWLAREPGNEAASRAARLLRRDLRPTVVIGTEGSGESGDPATSRVLTDAVPLEFTFHPRGGDLEVVLKGTMSRYRNSTGSDRDRALGAGVDAPVGNRLRLVGEMVSHQFDLAPSTFTGLGQIQLTPSDWLDVRVGLSREQLNSSRLSLSGEQYQDIFYGPSLVDQAMLGVSARPGHGWDLWVQATAGRIGGVHVADNRREEVFAGAGKSFRLGTMTLRPGYGLTWMSYDLDLGGFPSTDLAGDGVNTRGVGGYFSPFRFVNQMARLDATWPVGDSLLIVAGGGVGQQQVEDAIARDFGYRTTSSDGYLGVTAHIADRMSAGVHASYQNVASAFDRTVLRVTLGYGF